MRPLISLLLVLSCGVFAVRCGSSSDAPKQAAKKDPLPSTNKPIGLKKLVGNHFYLAPEIPSEEQAALAGDLSLIQSFDASLGSAENSELIRTLGVAGVDGPSLYKWLRDRLRFFMGQQLSVYNFAIVYPDESSYGYFKLADEKEEESRLTGAVNVGAGLYNFGRNLTQTEGRKQYLRMQIDTQWFDVTSPRVGIMQIGPALFSVKINPDELSAFANAAFRIQILFHEARHSDGNESSNSLGFTHVVCPSTSAVVDELKGKSACDVSTNGAYSVGALILRSYYRNCKNKCSIAEIEVLKTLYIDAFSRIIEPKRLDPAPEKGFAPSDITSFNRITIQ